MVVFNSLSHFVIIVSMIFIGLYLCYEVFNGIRLAIAEYQYNKRQRVQIFKPSWKNIQRTAYESVWGDDDWDWLEQK